MPRVESSAIRAVEHDGRTLTVTFASGRRYAYADVPGHVFAAFLAAASKGAYFNDHVRDAYASTELARLTSASARGSTKRP